VWVQALQQALNMDAYDRDISQTYGKDHWFPLVRDGKFGAHTEDAVKSLRAASHLRQDGIVGKQTWGAIGMCY